MATYWQGLLIAAVLCSGRAHAQGSPAPTDPPAPVDPAAEVRPPEIVTFVEAPYPPAAEAEKREGAVELLITIDKAGAVTEVSVVTPAGFGFDEAAVAAVKQFVFKPATKGGVPMASRIGYRYLFELKPAPPPPVEEPPVPAQDPATPPAETAPEDAAAALEKTEALEFSASGTVDPPPREVTRRTVGKEELTRIPGTRGDALRAVELLPGVGRPAFGAGVLLVRGSAPRDSGVFLGGSPIPQLYHFGGLTSVVNSRLLDRIDFYPGNFSVRYGRQIGGVLETTFRDPATDGFHGVLDVNLLDTSVLVEGPITDTWSVAAAARRSYIDFFFREIVPKDAFDVVSAPVYWDYQLLTTYKPSNTDKVSFAFYGSSDGIELILSQPLDGDPAIRGDFDQNTQFHRGQATWRHAISEAVDQEVMVSFGPSLVNFALGDSLQFSATGWQLYGRTEWTGRLNPRATITGGIDMFFQPFEIEYTGPPVQQDEGNPNRSNPFATQPTETVSASGVGFRPGAYLEGNFEPIGPLRVVPGVRLDYFRDIDSWAINPRVASILSVTDTTRLKGGVGLFSQPPDFAESSKQLGNPNLDPVNSLHTSLGVEQDLGPGISLGLEGYYKHLWNMVVGTVAGVDPVFVNEGLGRIYGLEVSGRVQPRGRPFFGFLSYTLSRSERRDRSGEPWRLFDFDQTHILSAAAVYMLGRGWEVGGAFRLVSGNPDTAITGGVFNDNAGVYTPVYGPVNGTRSSLFHRLDVRLEKKWTFESWRLAFYVDVQNVYNRQNQEGLLYNYNFTDSAVLPGLPIIPSLGLRGEL
jgi:TonB family protein